MFYDDDINNFFAESEFAKPAIWTTVEGVSKPITIIYDMPGQIQTIGNVGVKVEKITGLLMTSETEGIKRSDTITVDSIVYKVSEPPLPDGTGVTQVTLATGMR